MKPADLHRICQHVWQFDIVPPKSTAQGTNFNFKTGKRFFKEDAEKAKNVLINVIGARSPDAPIRGPLEMHVISVWPLNQEDTKTRERHRLVNRSGGIIRSTSKPDNDNFLKFLQDILKTTGYIVDDSQISDTHVYKRRGEKPCLIIGLSVVDQYFIDSFDLPTAQASLI